MVRIGITRTIRTPHLKEERRKHRLRNLYALLGISVSSLVLLWQVSDMPALAISSVVVVGNRAVATWDVEAIVEERLVHRLAFIFSRRNIFLVPRRAIADDMREHFSRIADVDLSLTAARSLVITVTERRPAALVCPYFFSDTVPDTPCLFADASGLLYGEAPYFSGHVIFSYHSDTVPVGGNVFAPDEFPVWQRFVESVRRMHTDPIALTVGKTLLVVHLKGGGELRVNRGDDLNRMAENVHTVLTSKDFADSVPLSLDNLDYIDLRYGNKIFFKTTRTLHAGE